MKKLLITVTLMAVAGWVYHLNSNQSQPDTAGVNPHSQPVATAPDFDRRKYQPVAPVATDQAVRQQVQQSVQQAVKQAEPVDLQQQEKQLTAIINNYNDNLHDPDAKARYQQQFKVQSAQYKQALLKKIERGEL